MCGIIGIVSKKSVNQSLYDGLTVLQHRGQDAAGIVTYDNGRFRMRKANGLVRDVFRTKHMLRLSGSVGIGHVRYPTAGCASSAEAQPFYVNSPYGITLAHNGNLTNANELKEDLLRTDRRHLNTDSDTEVLLNVFAHELQEAKKLNIDHNDVFAAIKNVHKRVKGAYAVVALIAGVGVVAFRDVHGIRPVVYGKKTTDTGIDYMIASESVALDALDFELIADIDPGEAVFISMDGELHTKQCANNVELTPCIFEHVYFARPDSIIDGISVYKARLSMGEFLAHKIMREFPKHDIDVVIPIPESSLTSALELANVLNIKYRNGFIKNRYIGRTFIMPGQKERKKSVRQKLNAIDLEFEGKNVLLVDDSIVRGTTSQQIIQMARDAGARKVYFASAAPPVCYQNVYGIDMPSTKELIGHERTVEEIKYAIGADWLIFQDIEDLLKSSNRGNPKIKRFDTSVFDGEYITGDIDKQYLQNLEKMRSDNAKNSSDQANAIIEMHNDN
jgi:amidophosphoribosyltransferase